jgi:hypothetical protein
VGAIFAGIQTRNQRVVLLLGGSEAKGENATLICHAQQLVPAK